MKIDSTSCRASFRLSKKKNLIETRIADLSRSSNPPKSKEHWKDSPSRYLKQPNFRYREIEKGGKCVAEEITEEDCSGDLIAKMREGEVGEQEEPLAEKPADADNEDPAKIVATRIGSLKRPIETGMTDLSKSRKHSSATHAIQQLYDLAHQVPQSSRVESPSRYLKQGEPGLRHEENLGDGIAVRWPEMIEVGEKEVSLVEKPISLVSLRPTEFFNMAVDEDNEVDSQQCAMDTIEGYRVKPKSMGILKKILTRHGDIAKNCTVSIMEFHSELLEMICGTISQLQGKELWQIEEDFLLRKIGLVDGMKNLEVDVEWLRVLLDDILKEKQKFGKLKEKKESNKKTIEDAERKLAQCQEQKRELSNLLKSKCDEEIVCQEALAKAKDESTRINQAIKSSISNAKRFLDCSSVDNLV